MITLNRLFYKCEDVHTMILFTDMYVKLMIKEIIQDRKLCIDLPRAVPEDENSGEK